MHYRYAAFLGGSGENQVCGPTRCRAAAAREVHNLKVVGSIPTIATRGETMTSYHPTNPPGVVVQP